MTRRALGVAVMLAALCWAPSIALGAPLNELTDAAASPSVGTTTTLFGLSVRYVSRSSVAADAVRVQVAGLDVPLLLIAGTAIDGTWWMSTLLPAGSWTPTFRAVVAHGPAPSLRGPQVVVSQATASASPETASGSPRMVPGEEGGGRTAPSPSAAPAPAAGQTMTPSSAPRPVASAPAGPGAAPPSAPGAPDSPGTATPPAGPNAPPGPVAGATQPPSSATRMGHPRGTASAAAAPTTPGLPLGRGPTGDGDLLLVLGVSIAAASMVLLGIGWMLTDRRDDDAPAAVRVPGRDGAAHAGHDTAGLSAAVAARRARRRSTGHDPVLAAMGLEMDGRDEAVAESGADAPTGERPRRRKGRRD